MDCPNCGEALERKVYDHLYGWGDSEYVDSCKSCDYTLHFAYGGYEEFNNGKLYIYNYLDLEKVRNGESKMEDFIVQTTT